MYHVVMPRGSRRKVVVSSRLSTLPMLDNGVVTRGEHSKPLRNQRDQKKKEKKLRDNRIKRVREVVRLLKSFEFVQMDPDEELWFPLKELHQEVGGSKERFARALQDAKDWGICWTKFGRTIYFYPSAVNYLVENKITVSSVEKMAAAKRSRKAKNKIRSKRSRSAS